MYSVDYQQFVGHALDFHAKKFGKFGGGYYIWESKRTGTMEINTSFGLFYQSPYVRIIELTAEGILCASGDESTESLGENSGDWGW